jgi:hypothetical protein
MTVTAERLLRALWKEDGLMLETLSLLSIERIALPWRRTEVPAVGTVYERRSIFGTLVADIRPVQMSPPAPGCLQFKIYAKTMGSSGLTAGIGLLPSELQLKADGVLSGRGWLVVNLPKLGPWESLSTGGWGRKTSLGDVAAWVKPQAEERRFKTYVILDEQEAEFEGTPAKAMDVVDRNLEHLGFNLG